jgi:hypothetical protein
MSKATVKIGGITVPVDLSHKELLKFLVENKSLLIAEKKAAIKEADGIPHVAEFSAKYFIDKEGKLAKAANNQQRRPPVDQRRSYVLSIPLTGWTATVMFIFLVSGIKA